jgi:hypothetical protein
MAHNLTLPVSPSPLYPPLLEKERGSPSYGRIKEGADVPLRHPFAE